MTVPQGSVKHQGGALPQPQEAQRRIGRMHLCTARCWASGHAGGATALR
jgi:hypothetical protein